MASIERRRYKTYEELGSAIIAARPDLQDRDPRDIGLQGEELLEGVTVSPSDFGDIDVRKAADRFGGDFLKTLGETVRGAGEMITSPLETAGALSTVGLTALEAGSEAAEAAGPPEAGQRRGGVGIEAVRSLLSKLSGTKLVSSEQREAVEGVGREFVDSVSPAGIQQRPALALSNLATVIPARGGLNLASKLPKVGKAAKIARKGLDFADPSTAPFAAAGAGTRAVKGTAKAGFNKVRQAQELIFGDKVLGSMRSTGRTLSSELFNGIIGFTTGTGSVFVRTMAERAGTTINRFNEKGQKVTEKFSDIVRKIRKGEAGPANDLLLQRALRAVDRVKEQAGNAFEKGKLAILGLKEPLEIRDLQQRARAPLADFNVGVTEKKVVIKYADVGPGGLAKTRPSGKYKLEFPDFGEGKGETTTISDIGNGRKKLNEIFTAFFDAPAKVTAEELMNFRRKIDDAISVASGETSEGARAALVGLRTLLSDDLKARVPGYAETMKEFETASIRLDRYHTDLGLDPGKLNEDGLFRDINVEESVSKILGAFVESQTNATRLPLLDELQRLGGDQSITAIALGIGSQAMFGKGLVVRAQLSEIGRSIGRYALAGSLGTLSAVTNSPIMIGVPAATMFSPRAMGEVLLRMGERQKTGKPLFAKTRARTAAAQEAGRKIAAAAEKIDLATGGKLREMATRKGMNLGLLLERLELQSGSDIQGLKFPEKERQESLLGTLGRGRLSSPGNRLER